MATKKAAAKKMTVTAKKTVAAKSAPAKSSGWCQGTHPANDQDTGDPAHGGTDGRSAEADRGVLRSPDRDGSKRDKKSGEFTVPGLGKLVEAQRAARMGRNLATGESIKIAAKTTLKFRIGKAVKDAVVPLKKWSA